MHRRRRGGRYIPILTLRMTSNRAKPGSFHKQNANIGRKTHTPGCNAGYHETRTPQNTLGQRTYTDIILQAGSRNVKGKRVIICTISIKVFSGWGNDRMVWIDKERCPC